jgi:hypothetical protein
MTDRPPYIRLLGDEDFAASFIRRGKIELYRTRKLRELMGVPTYQRRVNLSPTVLIDTLITGVGEYLTIYAILLPSQVEPVEPIPLDEFLRFPLFSLNVSDSDSNLTFIIARMGKTYEVKIYDGPIYFGSHGQAEAKKKTNPTFTETGGFILGWDNYVQNQMGDILNEAMRRDATKFLYYRGYQLTEFNDEVISAFVLEHHLVALIQETVSGAKDATFKLYSLPIPDMDLDQEDFVLGNGIALSEWDVLDSFTPDEEIIHFDPFNNFILDHMGHDGVINYIRGAAINKDRTEIVVRWLDELHTYSIEEEIVNGEPQITATRTITNHGTSGTRTLSNDHGGDRTYNFTTKVHLHGVVYEQNATPAAPTSKDTIADLRNFINGDFCAAINYYENEQQKITIPTFKYQFNSTTLQPNLTSSAGWERFPMEHRGSNLDPYVYVTLGTNMGPDTDPATMANLANASNNPDISVIVRMRINSIYWIRDYWDGTATFNGLEIIKAPWDAAGITTWKITGSGTSMWESTGDRFAPHEYYEWDGTGAQFPSFPDDYIAVPWHDYETNVSGSYNVNSSNIIYPYVNLRAQCRQEWHVSVSNTHLTLGPPSTSSQYSNPPYVYNHTAHAGVYANFDFKNKIIIGEKEFNVGFEDETVSQFLEKESMPVYFGFIPFVENNAFDTDDFITGEIFTTASYVEEQRTLFGQLIDSIFNERVTNIYVFDHPLGDIMIGGKKQYTAASTFKGNYLYVYHPEEEILIDILPKLEAAMTRYNAVKLTDETLTNTEAVDFIHEYMPTGKVIGELPNLVKRNLI